MNADQAALGKFEHGNEITIFVIMADAPQRVWLVGAVFRPIDIYDVELEIFSNTQVNHDRA